LCPPTIAMHACEAALDEPEQYLIDALAEYEVRRETTITCLRNIHGVEVAEPKGAFYCLARLPVNDTDDFAKWMLESFEHHGETVMIAPANGFFSDNTTGKDMIRIAFVLNSKKLERAIELLGLGLAEYVKK